MTLQYEELNQFFEELNKYYDRVEVFDRMVNRVLRHKYVEKVFQPISSFFHSRAIGVTIYPLIVAAWLFDYDLRRGKRFEEMKPLLDIAESDMRLGSSNSRKASCACAP